MKVDSPLKTGSYSALYAELDAWSAEGLTCTFWIRDDDAVSDTKQLRRLFEVTRYIEARVAIAVIPKQADEYLAKVLLVNRCCIWQHGWAHNFHISGEFGEERPLELMIDDALSGVHVMDSLFGVSEWQRVFVPPNHMLALPFKAQIRQLGYLGISAGNPLTPKLPGILEANATIDVMDWVGGRVLEQSQICDVLIEELRARRFGRVSTTIPIGILTHHLAFDEDGWQSISKLLAFIRCHPVVKFANADELFTMKIMNGVQQLTEITASDDPVIQSKPGITVVFTSCGRYDLLRRMLKSFFRFNTFPVEDIIVIEDGQLYNLPRDLLSDNRISFMSTGRRVGQIQTIDRAYEFIGTEYIFHCEDDWEFFAPSFIEKSLKVLMSNSKILQVWLRALDDTNRHPVLSKALFAGSVEYKLLDTGYDAGEWGLWHGFSFNPGLRRTSDYRMLGNYSAIDPQGKLKAWEIERAVSELYFDKGYVAAILADNNGAGYCKHLGWGLRIEQS